MTTFWKPIWHLLLNCTGNCVKRIFFFNKRLLHPNVDCSTIRRKKQKEQKATYLSIDRGLGKKIRCMYTVKYYLAIKKNKIMPFTATWMDLDYQKKWSKKENKYLTMLSICGIQFFKMIQMNLFPKQKQSHRCRKQVYCGALNGKP